MRASRAFDLPCPSVPLQSMTAAASRLTPGGPVPAASCRSKGATRRGSSCPGPGCAGRPKASGAGPFGRGLGDPGSARSRRPSDRGYGAGVRPGPGPPLTGLPKQPRSRRRTESDDDFPGFAPFRRFQLGRSLCRFASPTPSALRVSHPLSGLIPPGPRGFVSRHIRP
jgi:hypothetical protein